MKASPRRFVALVVLMVAFAGCGHASAPPTHLAVARPPDTVITTTTMLPTTTAPAPARLASPHVAASRTSTQARTIPTGDVWEALANCESHHNPLAVGHEVYKGKTLWFYGAFQFTLGTWQSLGYTGNPVDYPYEVQREAAQRLVARSGWSQFPVCGRRVA